MMSYVNRCCLMIHFLPYAGQHLPNGRTRMNNLDLESGNSGYIKITGTTVFMNMNVSGFLFCTMQNWKQLYVDRIRIVNILKCWFGPGFDSDSCFHIHRHHHRHQHRHSLTAHNVLTFINADLHFPLLVILTVVNFKVICELKIDLIWLKTMHYLPSC